MNFRRLLKLITINLLQQLVHLQFDLHFANYQLLFTILIAIRISIIFLFAVWLPAEKVDIESSLNGLNIIAYLVYNISFCMILL